MPVLLGLVFGRLFLQLLFSRAVLTLFLWAAIWRFGEDLGSHAGGPAAGWATGALTSTAVFGWTLWRPARSRAKLWMLDGFFVLLRLALILAVVMLVVKFYASDGVMSAWVRLGWPFALGTAAAWGAQRVLAGLLVRSHHREGDMSMLPD